MSMAEAILAAGPVTGYPYAGLMRRILAYYDLDCSPAICFGLGCELDFVLPGPDALAGPPAPGFNGNRFPQELSRATGMMYREVRSLGAGTFVHYLDLEWEDYAGKMQPLPILTHLPLGAGLRPVLLIDRSGGAEYTFLCGLTGELLHLHAKELEAMSLPEYSHIIFHQPLNIIKHPTKYRPLRSSVAYALHTTVHQLTAGIGSETGLPAMRRFTRLLCEAALAPQELLALARYYLAVTRDNADGNGLYRLDFAAFLIEAAHVLDAPDLAEIASVYRKLAARWGLFLEACGRFHTRQLSAEAFREGAGTVLAPIAEAEEHGAMLIRAYLEKTVEFEAS